MSDLCSRLTTGQTSRCLLSCEITQPGGNVLQFPCISQQRQGNTFRIHAAGVPVSILQAFSKPAQDALPKQNARRNQRKKMTTATLNYGNAQTPTGQHNPAACSIWQEQEIYLY